MQKEAHWEHIYSTKDTKAVSWFREHLEPSLALIGSAQLKPDAHIIDVGGGSSTLVDDLLDRGFMHLTVLDISSEALEKTKRRLGDPRGATWVVADITQVALPSNSVDLWHDRAVFHFLIDPVDREFYRKNLKAALKPNGHLVIATFAADGPLKCSGLDVERYDIEKLTSILGSGFELVQSFQDQHKTPFDTTQNFLYAHFRRTP